MSALCGLLCYCHLLGDVCYFCQEVLWSDMFVGFFCGSLVGAFVRWFVWRASCNFSKSTPLIVMKFGTDIQRLHQMSPLTFEGSRSTFKVICFENDPHTIISMTWSDKPEPPAVAIVRQNGLSSASSRASVANTPVSRQIWWTQVVDGRPQARLHSCEGRSLSLSIGPK